MEAAYGIRQVVNVNMARAIRAVTIERGRDPRLFTLSAFGGSGPVHAVDVARALDIRRVLVPILPGVFTAAGMLASDVEHHFVRTHVGLWDAAVVGPLNAAIEELRREAIQTLVGEGYAPDRIALQFQLDLRHMGQGSELAVPLSADRLTAGGLAHVSAAFREEYGRTYGSNPEDPVEVVNVRLIATGLREERLRFEELRNRRRAGRTGGPSRRPVYFGRETGYVDTVIYQDFGALDDVVPGPAIIESYDSTIVIPPDCVGGVDEVGNMTIELAAKT